MESKKWIRKKNENNWEIEKFEKKKINTNLILVSKLSYNKIKRNLKKKLI